ncbi:MAG: hypothetical protein GXP21_09550 [Gammaproteobacteria bacterium]|nr:hypothetical protein [Gammaproteobacteria bacterium]
MLNTLKLLLPALLPSWRFFDFIAPSPRIQFALLRSEDEVPNDWVLFRPRPAYLSFTQMLGRMVWNPVWNESLFMVSCAERIIEQPTQHSEDEILKRIRFELAADMLGDMKYIQFRLVTVQRVEKELVEEFVFQSRLEPIVR